MPQVKKGIKLKVGNHVSNGHPRSESIRIRERLTRHIETKVLALAGLIAHGRGEAFDYILGEKTTSSAQTSITAAVAMLLLADQPVLSVNGNVAALCARELVDLSNVTGAKLEVNLFHRLPGREEAIEAELKEAGARGILGVDGSANAKMEEVFSDRRTVDPRGIYIADVVFVPLEDGDRTEGLVRMGKKVVTVDLNPISRTAQFADVTIVDNVVRAMPLLVSEAKNLKKESPETLREIVKAYSNRDALSDALKTILKRLAKLSESKVIQK